MQGNLRAVRPGTAQLPKAFRERGRESRKCTGSASHGRFRMGQDHTQPRAPERPGDSSYLLFTLPTAFHNTKIASLAQAACLSLPPTVRAESQKSNEAGDPSEK